MAAFCHGFSQDPKNGLDEAGDCLREDRGLEVCYNAAVGAMADSRRRCQVIWPGAADTAAVAQGLAAQVRLF